MKLFTLKHFEWEGRAYRPGQFITVQDHNIAQLMITALRAVDAGGATAPAANTARAAELLRELKSQRLTGPVVATLFRR